MIRRFLNSLLEIPPVKFVLDLANRIKPWGFEGLSLYFVAKFFIEGVQKGSLSTRSAAISFRLFLSVFPGIILLLSIIPLIPIENFQENLFDNIRTFFPGDTFSLVESTLDDLLNKKHNTLLSIGFVLVIFYASNSVNAILIGFNGSYNLEKKGNPVWMRVASVILLIVLGLFMVIAVALIAFSGVVFDYFQGLDLLPDAGIVFLIDVARWLITIFLIYLSISTLYNVGNFRTQKWKTFSAGASFATLFFILASLLFAWFVSSFAQFNKLYGSLGTLLILLIWINFTSTILLLGFELNTSIQKAKHTFLDEPNS